MNGHNMETEAMRLARQGIPVFPVHTMRDGMCTCDKAGACPSAGKHPYWKQDLLENGHNGASTGSERVRVLWRQWPEANIGAAVPEGLLVLDVDPRNGGDESLRDLCAEHGDEWLDTVTAITGGGGSHFWFKLPSGTKVRNSASNLGSGLDVKAQGGYVIVPPSLHKSGARYEWQVGRAPWEMQPREVPEWLLVCLAEKPNGGETKGSAAPVGEVIPEGTRNKTLASIAGTMRRRGVNGASILAALREENALKCSPPLSEEEVARIASSIASYPPGAPPTISSSSGAFEWSDIGNAEQLVTRFGERIRYVRQWKTWMVYDGTRWVPDRLGKVEQFAKEVARALRVRGAQLEDRAERGRVWRAAEYASSDRGIRAMLARAESEPTVAVAPEAFDTDPWLLNVANGTIDLRTGHLRPHAPNDLISKLAPVEYRPEATLPLWEQFLATISNGDADLVCFLQRFAGYCATGSTREEKLLFVHGDGGTGKSTFIEAIKATLGDYAATADFETFLAGRHSGSPRPDIARLVGARLVSSVEVEEGKKLAEGLIKQVTGGDTITARFLYSKEFEFVPQFKLILVANHVPVVRDDDEALWRRILRVPFEHVIPKSERDPRVKEQLRDREIGGPAILAWLVRGALDWQQRGLQVPTVVDQATAQYRLEMDEFADFFDEMLDFHPAAEAFASAIWQGYLDWCKTNGVVHASQRKLGMKLRARGCQSLKGTGGKRKWRGVAVRDCRGSDPWSGQSGASGGSGVGIHKSQLIPSEESDFVKVPPLPPHVPLRKRKATNGAAPQAVRTR